MNLDQFKELNEVEIPNHLITPRSLSDLSDRTLLYGYTTDRFTWHIYLKDGIIHGLMYKSEEKKMYTIVIETNEDYIPNKRLYAEACDFEFCKTLKQRGVTPVFTTFDEEREEKQYYGRVL